MVAESTELISGVPENYQVTFHHYSDALLKQTGVYYVFEIRLTPELIGSVSSSHHFHKISFSPSLKSKVTQNFPKPLFQAVYSPHCPSEISPESCWILDNPLGILNIWLKGHTNMFFLHPEDLLFAILVSFHTVDHFVG